MKPPTMMTQAGISAVKEREMEGGTLAGRWITRSFWTMRRYTSAETRATMMAVNTLTEPKRSAFQALFSTSRVLSRKNRATEMTPPGTPSMS